jgi:Tfp pilus assembly protein PilV
MLLKKQGADAPRSPAEETRIMIRRPAVTLMEVLVTMFIMAIGMLALLALFPLGAVSMAQALKDDRCASAASMAEQFAIAMNVRHDPSVSALFKSLDKSLPATYPGTTLPYNGPSFPLYVDPYYASTFNQVGTSPPYIARTTVSYATTPQLMDRWFTLPNDITFTNGGVPDVSGGQVERGREYSWAYLLQRPQANNHDAVNLTVVVYHKRATAVPEPEQTYSASGTQYGNGLVLQWNPATQSPNLKRGIWLLDTTPTSAGLARAAFYRVVNISDSISGQAALDVQPNLANNVSQVVLMSDVAEVFQKGTSWRP